MGDLARDAGHTFRQLTRNRGFAAAALVTIALAVGGAGAVFAVVFGVMFRPPPFADADRLVRLWETHPGAREPIPGAKMSGPTYRAWSASSATIQDMAAFGGRDFTVSNGRQRQRVRGTRVAPSLFRVLGVFPARGRFFREDDAREGAPAVVVLSDGFWRERFGGDGGAVGRTLVVDDVAHEIVGVAPPGFAFPDSAVGLRDDRQAIRLYTPLALPPVPGATVIDYTEVIARLKPEATIAQAESEGTARARAADRPMADLVFGTGRPVEVRVRSLVDHMTAGVRPALHVVAAAVVLVLLVACANLANLCLSRGIDRTREMAVRSALGASRRRLVQQLVVESLVTSSLGGAAGLLGGWALTTALTALAPADFPRLDQIRMDGWVVGMAALAAMTVGTLAGVAPAVSASRTDVTSATRDGGRTTGVSGGRLRRVLIALEAAFSVVLLIGAALLARSFVALVRVDAGYEPAGVVTADVRLADGRSDADASSTALAIVERLRATPGIQAAGAGDMAPFGSMLSRFGFRLPGVTAADGKPVTATALRAVITPGYAEALGMRLREGRLLQPADTTAASRAILVNEAFVKAYLADGRPVAGRRFVGLFPRWLGAEATVEVVGVVDDMLPADLDGRRQPQIFVAAGGKAHIGHITVVSRTVGNPAAMIPQLRTAVQHVAPDATTERTGPLADKLSASVATPRFTMAVLASLALLALGLAAIGIHAAVSYDVAQRRREIGVRTALGASRNDIRRLVLREGLVPTTVGLVAGVGLAALLTHAIASALFGVPALDAVSFVAAPLLLAGVACAACLIPARRALTDSPVDALRAD